MLIDCQFPCVIALAQGRDWSGGPHGNPDWTIEDYQTMAENLGWSGFANYPEESQLYLGKLAVDLVNYELATGKDMSVQWDALLREAPGLVLTVEDKLAFALAAGPMAFLPGGSRGNFQKINDGLLKQNNIDAHALKREYLGPKAKVSRYDLYQNKSTGQVYIMPKGGNGSPVETWVNIRPGG